MRLDQSFIADIKDIMQAARNRAYAAVNFYMVEAYWKIGERIVVEEQKGHGRAQYGAFLIRELSKKLTADLGKGFTISNLKYFRQFYLCFGGSQKVDAVRRQFQGIENECIEKSHAVRGLSESLSSSQLRRELTWTHYRLILGVASPDARNYYMNEAADNNWSTRVLERNINTFYFERILSHSTKKADDVKSEAAEKHSPSDFIKDPYLLEFLNMPEPHLFSEREIETALVEHLKQFLIELGKGFAFIGNQYRLNSASRNFYIDLVFYNVILKCYVLFDIKTGKLTSQDIGQIDAYVRTFDDIVRDKSDNPTIGIILCTDKDATIVKYSVLNGNEQLFATKYKSYLPSEQELIAEIERSKLYLKEKLKNNAFQ